MASVGNASLLEGGDATKAFDKAWKVLAAQEELVCAHTGMRHAPIPQPEVFIVDVSSPLDLPRSAGR